jgi:hypothetical protein
MWGWHVRSFKSPNQYAIVRSRSNGSSASCSSEAGEAHRRCSEDDDGDGGARRGSRTRRRGAESAAASLLLRFPAAACSGVVERGGAPRVQYLAGVAGFDEPEREGGREGVWAVAGSEASVSVWSAGVFIGRSVGEESVQYLTGAGALATLEGRSGHGGLGGVLGGFWLGRGVLWVGAGEGRAVGRVQRRRWLGGGPGRVSPPPSTSHGLGRGRGRWVRPRRLPGAWRQCLGELEQCSTSELDLVWFLSASVRRNARKNLKFEFLKFSTLGDQHIGQGVLSYFCYKEIRSSAEILFQVFGWVFDSDSKFDRNLSDVLIWILGRNFLVEFVCNLVKLN